MLGNILEASEVEVINDAKEIPLETAALLLNNLMTGAIPVLAVFISENGVGMKLYGHVDSITTDVGVVVSASQAMPSMSSSLTVPIGKPVGSGCRFFVGTAPDDDLKLKYGDTVLSVRPSSGGRLMLFFTVPKSSWDADTKKD